MRFRPMTILAFLVVFCGKAAAAGDAPAGAGKPAPPKRLFIVAPDHLRPAVADYVKHKQTIMPTELVSLEEVLKSTDGVDDPERLKRFLYVAWKEHDLGYVLLVGDVDVLPVRYMVLDRATPAAFDYAFYPSDLYYSDLARSDGKFDDWNASREGFHGQYFGEVRGEKNKNDPINFDQINYLPDVAVGRWPVSTPQEARIVADKSIAYEDAVRVKTHPGMGRVAIFHPGGWMDARGRLGHIADAFPADWHTSRYFFGGPASDPGSLLPTEKSLEAVLDEGAGLVIHAGHGSEKTWEGCFTMPVMNRLKNRDRLPVMVSAGCSTAYFAPLAPYDGYVDVNGKEHKGTDAGELFTAPPPAPSPYQTGKHNPTGLGEQLLKKGPDGAVVYIGCCTGSQPCALTLVEGFARAAGQSPARNVGDCWAGAVSYYFEHERLSELKPNADWYPPSIFFQGMKFMVFGDPTLPLALPR
ncbi:MAG TPA: C25 family cysteine peptidase [Tepidisphaeraceae bacterium]|jgi:hypothetical protein|nr:C25 family cysteine peptidase [Tepidisphaeraceae bacterium]